MIIEGIRVEEDLIPVMLKTQEDGEDNPAITIRKLLSRKIAAIRDKIRK